MTSAPCSAPIRNYALLALALALAPGWQDRAAGGQHFQRRLPGHRRRSAQRGPVRIQFGNQVLPGSYMVDVVRDGNALGQSQLRFEEAPGKRDAQPA